MINQLLGDATWPITLLVVFEIALALYLLLPRRRRRGSSGKPLVDDVLRLASRPRGANRPLL